LEKKFTSAYKKRKKVRENVIFKSELKVMFSDTSLHVIYN